MALLTWSDQYATNIRQIDNQHKRLVELVNELHEAMRLGKANEILGKILDGLIEYTKVHFSTEELLMKQHAYPEMPFHKVKHDDLVKQVLDLQNKMKSGQPVMSVPVMNFLKDWLTKHILEVDKKLGGYLVKKGMS